MKAVQKPAADEIEVSIFGGGAGYGECVIIHLGDDRWMIVDSTMGSASNQPLALEYLERLGGVPSENVRMIMASHWHDDHIKGLYHIVENFPEAAFVCSQAMEKKQFLILLEQSKKISSLHSGMREFRAIFHLLKDEKRKIIRAVQDRVLLQSELPNGTPVKVFTLSPSDEAIGVFESQLKNLIDDLSPNRVVTPISPNHSSVVTVIKIGETQICLGGDLENTSSEGMGWQAVLNAQLTPKGSISLFKVPHHGSNNAYHPPFWEQTMTDNPIAALTPYARGRKKLPAPEDIDNIYRHTSSAYITAPVQRGPEKKRDPKANKMIKSLGYDVREVPFAYGHIRLRKQWGQDNWAVDLYGKAVALKDG